MKLLLSLYIIVVASVAVANQGIELKIGAAYDSNVYYSEENEKSDFVFFVMPSWNKNYAIANSYHLAPKLNLEYMKYMSESAQDYFQYDFGVKNSVRIGRALFFEVSPKFKFDSEPAYINTSDSKSRDKRLGRSTAGGVLGVNYFKDDRRQLLSNLTIEQESFDQARYEFQNNLYYNGTIYYKKYFLPETFFYFGYRGSFKSYPNREKAPVGRAKSDHTRYEPGFGIEGRLNRYFKIRMYAGYALLKYKVDKGYADPIVLVEVEEELSPKDMLVMGYQTKVEDSYYGNYSTEQKLYVGYGRLYGDQLFLNAKVEYSYKNFVGLEVRDDQRIVGIISAEYSKSEKLKYELRADYNQLQSNTINAIRTDYPDPVDPPASFSRISTAFLIKYLF